VVQGIFRGIESYLFFSYNVRNLIASNIEEHIEEYLRSVITEEDIA